MPETVLYIRSPFPFGPDRPISDRFVEDAKLFLHPSEEQFNGMRAALVEYPGFLSREALISVLSQFFPDDDRAARVAKFILTIDERSRLPGFHVEDLAGQIAEWLKKQENQEEGAPVLSPSELQVLSQRFSLLFESLPGLARQAKARSLVERIGQPLERLELICDLRPVFDANRDNVEGMIPLTTLRLVCKGADGLPIAFDAVLSERDVHSLANASRDAKKKLKRLRDLMLGIGIAIPEVDATQQVTSDADEDE